MRQPLLLRFIIVIAFFGGSFGDLFAQNSAKNEDVVLFLNSINFNLPWAKDIYWHAHDLLTKEGIPIKTESLSVPALRNRKEVEAVLDLLRQKYPTPPRAIVLIGDPGWIVCRELFDDIWKDVPVIITNSREYLPASLDILLSHEKLTKENTISSEKWREGYNVTVLRQTYYVSETIRLMLQLMPEMKRLAFISDDRYISEMARSDVDQAVKDYYPELTVEHLATTHVSTEALLDTLRSYDQRTGVIYYSWFESHNKEDNNYLFDHIQEIIYNFTPTPLFLLASEDLSNDTFAGGYYVSSESFAESLVNVLHRVLKGESPRSIPGSDGGKAQAYLNYRVLQAHGIREELYPKDVVYINLPESFFTKYQKEIIYGGVLLLLLLLAAAYYIGIMRRAYRKLREAKEHAEEANRLKSAFLANMSHEIRTPLNAIVGFSNMLPDVEDPEEMREYANIIESNTELLLQLINDILDMSKIEAGTFDFHKENIELKRMFSEVAASVRCRINNPSVLLEIEDDLPDCLFFTDKNRLSQVLTNLAVNAIKFTAEGTIRMGYRLEEDDTIYFYVSDTGCGMSKEQCEHVFERFVKYNPFIQGTGLGLSICQMIVEMQEGKIGVESELGKGSLFWFTLPYKSE